MVVLLIIIAPAVVRSWRNRQTRTFEGRMGDRMGSSPIDRTKKNDLYIHCASLFFCKGVRDLNGTLRKQHGALFLVPGVIATALAAQKKAYETPAPAGLRSKSHRPHQQKRRYCYRLFFIFYQKWCGVAAYFKKLISNPLNRYNSFLILLTLFQ